MSKIFNSASNSNYIFLQEKKPVQITRITCELYNIAIVKTGMH